MEGEHPDGSHYQPVEHPEETKRRIVRCRLCGEEFVRPGKGQIYCSKECRTKVGTAMHRRYVAANREHVREYARNRRYTLWGRSNAEIAKQAEKLAFDRILPLLGFVELYDVTRVRRFMPFDIIGTWKGERVLVDVTTCVGKSGPVHRSAIEVANALGMRLMTLFVKPDFRSFSLCDAAKYPCVRIRDLIPLG